MTPARNCLVIAYYFPPLGLSGVQRTLKFVKYLPKYGWQPTVLTVTPTGYYAQDYTLLDEIHPYHIEVVRVGSLDPNRLFRKKGVVKMPSERGRKLFTFLSDTFFIPDNKIGWKRQAVKAAREIMAKKNIDVIFSTAPPFTDFLIGHALHKECRKPLVVDYRDAWHDYPYKYHPTPYHKWRNYALEKKVLRAASRIITTNRRVKELILKRYKFLDYHDVTIIPQGFDPYDFMNSSSVVQKRSKMRFTHAGVFYADRTPKYFLRALERIFKAKPELKQGIEAYFVGNFQEEYQQMVSSMGLAQNVTVTGYLDHQRCIQQLIDSDVLWLTVKNDRQSPGKVYEYLGARKPILACIPDGFIMQTLREAGGSLIVPPSDVEAIARGILTLYEQYKHKKLSKPKEDVVVKYDRIELTNELSKIFGFLVE